VVVVCVSLVSSYITISSFIW